MKPIYGAIACHISSKSSLNSFIHCLNSVLVQTKPLNLFCVSWSSDDKELVEKTAKFCLMLEEKFLNAGIVTKFLHQPLHCQQFQHFEHIFRFIADSAWYDAAALIVTGDADDKWADHRVAYMYERAVASPKNVVVFNWTFDPFLDIRVKAVLDAAKQPHPIATHKMGETFEHFNVAVRFGVYAQFFQELTDSRYLDSPYCDLAYCTFLSQQPYDEAPLPDHDTTHGLYYYAGAHNSAGRNCRSADEFLLKFLESQLMECYPRSLLRPHDMTGYGHEQRPFTVKKAIDIGCLWGMKDGSMSITEYIKF